MTIPWKDAHGDRRWYAGVANEMAHLASGALHWIGDAHERIQRAALCRRNAAGLQQMPDQLLRDIGLSRGGIENAVEFHDIRPGASVENLRTHGRIRPIERP